MKEFENIFNSLFNDSFSWMINHSFWKQFDGSELFSGLAAEKFENYAARGLLFGTKGRGDVCILPANNDARKSAEVLPFLHEVGLGPDKIIFLDHIGHSEIIDLNSSLRFFKEQNQKRNFQISAWSGKEWSSSAISEITGINNFSLKPEIVQCFDDKCFFQNINHWAIPQGQIIENDEIAYNIIESWQGEKLVIKASHSASAGASMVLRANGVNGESIDNFWKITSQYKAVCQEFIDHNESPSVNVWIDNLGRVKPLFLSDQLLSKSKSGALEHEGNVFPSILSPQIQSNLNQWSIQIANIYAQNGYCCNLGIDWMNLMSVDNQLLNARAGEANARFTAPFYGMRAMHYLGAKSFCMKNLNFKKGLSPADIREKIDSVFWRDDLKEGVIFFNYHPSIGKMVVIGLGDCRERSIELCQETENLLN